MDTIVTRFAPSPTGYLHIGGIRTALINYILVNQSKKTNSDSKFILRIEDTDKKRSKQEFANSILKSFQWLEVAFDGEPFYQSKNKASQNHPVDFVSWFCLAINSRNQAARPKTNVC